MDYETRKSKRQRVEDGGLEVRDWEEKIQALFLFSTP
jgi:hypothetical protein